jgi:uncharacterized protein (DUF2236 family)
MGLERGSRIAAPRMDDAAGLYGPGSEAWRLNREALLLLGAGPRALLLQIAHPLVAEGVDQHSGFREDPWSRLAATTASYLRIVYGSGPAARAEIRRLNALHRAIGGPTRDLAARRRHGPRYAARDPELSLWVHATLVDSTIVAFDRWIQPLTRHERARYYEETKPIGRAFGVPGELLPADLEAFETYLASMLGSDGPVHPTATARDLAGSILHPSLGPLVRQPPLASRLGPAREPLARLAASVPARAYDWAMLPALALVPEQTRAEYGIRWGPIERTMAAWLERTWRFWRPRLPAGFRQFGQARAADRRTAA